MLAGAVSADLVMYAPQSWRLTYSAQTFNSIMIVLIKILIDKRHVATVSASAVSRWRHMLMPCRQPSSVFACCALRSSL